MSVQNVAEWATATGNPRAYLSLQYDGKLVVVTSDGKALWHSHTNGIIRKVDHLIMQNDGHLVLYNDNGSATWCHRMGNINN